MATIVFADDDRNCRFVIGAHLQLLGHRVRLAASGREALALVAAERPSLVILDLMMPDLDGYSACRALRADPATADIPVMLLTALDHRDNLALADGTRFDAVLNKPFKVEALRACVDGLLVVPAAA